MNNQTENTSLDNAKSSALKDITSEFSENYVCVEHLFKYIPEYSPEIISF